MIRKKEYKEIGENKESKEIEKPLEVKKEFETKKQEESLYEMIKSIMLEVLKEKEKIDYRPSNRIIQLIANNKDCIYGLTGNGDILAIYDSGRIFQITTYEDYSGYEDSEDSEDCNNS